MDEIVLTGLFQVETLLTESNHQFSYYINNSNLPSPVNVECTSCDLLSPQDSKEDGSSSTSLFNRKQFKFQQWLNIPLCKVMFIYAVSKSTEGNATLAFKVTSL